MVLLRSEKIQLGMSAPDFTLPGVDGKKHSLANYSEKKALVIIFMCNHCPYVQPQWRRFSATEKQFRDRGVQFLAINANDSGDYPEDSFEKMKEYAVQYGQEFPYLHDKSQEVARAYGAVCTPDIFIYDGAKKLAYHGRLDDNWQYEDEVKKRDLALALEDILDGKQPSADQKPSMGCSIKWKS